MTEQEILRKLAELNNISYDNITPQIEERRKNLLHQLARIREKERNDNMYKYVPNRKVIWMH